MSEEPDYLSTPSVRDHLSIYVSTLIVLMSMVQKGETGLMQLKVKS